eukprot:TRINITY_DN24267_c0_g1_i1.p1 TRINITY_DN24267_c0_g1~~TRINITY_DN24267_c0_g1_i1.p1  ORF type:complete len:258 (-),score=32.39 TRINITY_DN24267_c0_g1_i1:16-789(-)
MEGVEDEWEYYHERQHRAKTSASEAGVITGLNKNIHVKSLWEWKTSKIWRSVGEASETEAIAHGKHFEPYVRAFYGSLLAEDMKECEYKNHPDPQMAPIMGAIPDGITTTHGRIIEIKCPYYVDQWDMVPLDYMAQVQYQMEVWSAQYCDFVCYFHKSGLVIIWRIYRSAMFWKWMKERIETFVHHVDTNTPIPPESLPHVAYEAEEIVRSNYNFKNIKVDKKKVPPKVYYDLLFKQVVSQDTILNALPSPPMEISN